MQGPTGLWLLEALVSRQQEAGAIAIGVGSAILPSQGVAR